ncbi:MAG: hypothetical protein ACLQHF_15845 [Terracidiphilus sp.]
MSLPLLERLVHTPKDLIPSNLAMMKIRLSGNWELQKNAMIDPQTGGCFWFYRDLATARDRFKDGPSYFAVGMSAFAVAIPSVILPVWNVVLFPQGHSFWEHISLESVDAFALDRRLFPEEAAIEPPENEKPA